MEAAAQAPVGMRERTIKEAGSQVFPVTAPT